MSRIIIVATIVLASQPALAQKNNKELHDRFHIEYKDWRNNDNARCCDDGDCRPINNDEERESPNGIGLEVRIENTWCRVLAHHYLKSGNAPDWTSSHVCVRPTPVPGGSPPCSRFLCYQPKPRV